MTNIQKITNISAVVLAGGKSRRMGKDKRTLEWGGTTFLDKVCLTIGELFDEIILVTAIEDYPCGHLPVRLVTDAIPQKGSLGGIYTGIKEASYSSVFVVACDMPFLNPFVISRLCALPETDVVMPKLSTGYQPLHARYSKRCSFIMEKMIQKGNLRIQSLIQDPSLSIQIVEEPLFEDIDPHGYSFLNINTPADYEFARKADAHLK
ncbi:molybdenum cofactor guanylyltransferase [Candidatus Nitrospira allomarina]|uniref:Probable molybdenum cofactor guanylyltransferase n=1 Tax=Candidatus Nitrospira allomarina TaxID=3020900 RepID=A0AA96JZ26_9BACT|nr:molybdenum cofactor guanylyltransferase [Candidatus Nitrospira allomarina]WNM58184.1 molybdenum cofactor guanylyltransferase [Candidatus Nitrospira allomarina]